MAKKGSIPLKVNSKDNILCFRLFVWIVGKPYYQEGSTLEAMSAINFTYAKSNYAPQIIPKVEMSSPLSRCLKKKIQDR
jgi:hypothetical protein